MPNMKASSRIVLNSIYIYIGVIACTVLSLFTVPVLLHNLGASDYGLYNLVAGVIAMLSFVKSSMIVTVQRYMNVAYGANDLQQVNRIFTICLYLYIVIAFITVGIIELLGPFISNGFLNIEYHRIAAAAILFQVLVINTFFTTVSIPYDALFNVYEDMWLFSFFNTFEAILRLALAYGIAFVNSLDKLVVYAIGVSIIAFVTFGLKWLFCTWHYKGIKIVKLNRSDICVVKELFSFIGWNLYSTLARIFNTQGFAVVLNLFAGTSINAAYGIANQVNGSLNHFTSSVEKAFNPQIMKSEGMNERDRVIHMSLMSTKWCALIYSFFAIPLLVALPYVLKLWLNNPPEHTITFTRIVLSASMIAMTCTGITSSFYAVGQIKQYLIWLGTLMICNVFIGYGIAKIGASVEFVIGLLIILELVLLVIRLYYAKKIVNMLISAYIIKVLKPYLMAVVPTVIIAMCIPCDNFVMLLVLCFVSSIVYITVAYKFSVEERERAIFLSIIKSINKKIR